MFGIFTFFGNLFFAKKAKTNHAFRYIFFKKNKKGCRINPYRRSRNEKNPITRNSYVINYKYLSSTF